MAALKEVSSAGRIFGRCLDSDSPATADRWDRALVLTGGVVNCRVCKKPSLSGAPFF